MENQNKVIKKYWVAGFPYFESRAFFVPNEIREGEESLVKMQVYDPDGAKINEITMVVNSTQPLVLDLENFMGDCKPESGLKYCLLVCEMDKCVDSYVRLQMKKSGSYESELKEFSEKTSLFFPLNFTKSKSSVLILANEIETPVKVCCKVLRGNRAPEKSVFLAPMSSRVVFLKDEFQDVLGDCEENTEQVYLRLSAGEDTALVGAQILYYFEGGGEDGIFTLIA